MFQELDRVFENSKSSGYPPYNIVQISDDEYMISIAVAGFTMDNLDITKDRNILRIEGSSPESDEEVIYLHKGIGSRNFRREFTLADHVEVKSAELELGMLNIRLERNVPEEMQPKKIAITAPDSIEA
jgi:molecular chaperone IbpA